jgi:flagellin
MAISVNNNTNAAALLALQGLNNTQDQLQQTQDVVDSGLAVSAPQDNPAIWSIAQNQQQQVNGLVAVTQSLNRASSISDVAAAAGQTVLNLLDKLKSDALSASDRSLDAASRAAYDSDFKSLLTQITSTFSNATFDGANLLDGSSAGNLAVLASSDGSSFLTLSSTDLSLGGSVITVSSTASLGTATLASGLVGQIDASIANVTKTLANLGVQADQISAHAAFVGTLSDTLQTGVGVLVNADMGAESARLQALQVQQQLSAQSLSIANQAPSTILSLFR